jgi:hypothetical protein
MENIPQHVSFKSNNIITVDMKSVQEQITQSLKPTKITNMIASLDELIGPVHEENKPKELHKCHIENCSKTFGDGDSLDDKSPIQESYECMICSKKITIES